MRGSPPLLVHSCVSQRSLPVKERGVSLVAMNVPAGGELRRVIGFWGGTALIVGITIGSGIFRKPPTIAGLVPNPLVIMALWGAFGLISICGALTLAELSSMLPRPGGVYVYLREAYGDSFAFVFGWLYVLVTTPANVAALSTVFAEFLLNLAGRPSTTLAVGGIAIAAI